MEQYKNFLFFVALTPVIFAPLILYDAFNFPKIFYISILTSSIFFIFLKNREIKIIHSQLLLPLVIFTIWNIFLLFRCINIFTGLHRIFLLFLFITYFYFFYQIIDRKNQTQFLKILIGISVLISIYGFFQIAGLDIVSWDIKRSPISTFGRRNFAAEYFVMVIPFLYFFLKTEKRKLVYGIILLLFILYLIFTFTRASWIAFLFSTLLFFLMDKRKLKWKFFLLLLILFISINSSKIKKFESGSVKSRILIWKITFKMIKQNLLAGVGPGNFQILYPFYTIGEKEVLPLKTLRVGNAHNDYLEIAAETGIPGLLLFLFILFTAGKIFLKILKENKNPKEKTLATGIMSSIFAICINAFASFPFKNPATLFLFFTNLALLEKLNKNNKEKILKFKFLVFFYFFIFIFATVFMGERGIKANYYRLLSHKSKNPQISYEMIKKSVVSNPFNYETLFEGGKLALKLNRLKEAERYLLLAKQLHPYFEIVYNNLGIVYFKMGKYKKAEENYLFAIKLNPFKFEIYNNLGSLYLEEGKVEKSIVYFKKAIELKNDFYIAIYNLGVAYFETKKYKKAYQQFRKVLKIIPDFKPALLYISKLQKLSKP